MTSSFSTRTYASPTIARSSRTKMSLFIEVAMCLTQLRDQGSGIRDPRKTTTFCYLRSSDPGSRLPNPVVSFLSGPHPGRHRRPDRHIRALPDGQELSGIHDAVRIKRPLHTLHRHQVGVGKHPAHVLPLSIPTPCSPVMVPPASTQARRISSPARTTLSMIPGSRGLNRMIGCKLPSPAWKRFPIRS